MKKKTLDVLKAFGRAHSTVWKKGIRKYLAVPLILTLLYLPVLIAGLAAVSWFFTDFVFVHLGVGENPSPWLLWTARVLLFALFGVPAVISFRTVVLLFYGPFLERIAEKVETTVLNRPTVAGKGMHLAFGRMLVMASCTLTATVVLTVFSLFFSLIPVVGGIVVIGVIVPLQLFVAGVEYMDPVLDIKGCTLSQSLNLLFKHFFTMLAFGALGTLILLIPVLGWFVGPTYSIVAAVFIASDMVDTDAVKSKE